jgi:hypothetical protein
MAIGWLTVLQSVPWADVIANAPKVADGAKRLWNAVGKKSPAPELPAESAQPAPSSEAEAIAELQARLSAMEAAASDLHDQMLASSELIKALADQNAQLIKGIEANRIRVAWLVGVTVVIGIIAAAGLAVALFR